jgi:hypothetical protein
LTIAESQYGQIHVSRQFHILGEHPETTSSQKSLLLTLRQTKVDFDAFLRGQATIRKFRISNKTFMSKLCSVESKYTFLSTSKIRAQVKE